MPWNAFVSAAIAARDSWRSKKTTYKENDTTLSWKGIASTNSSASPVTAVDPEG